MAEQKGVSQKSLTSKRRYSLSDLVFIGQKVGSYVDFSKFAPDAIHAGIVAFPGVAQRLFLYPMPLSDIPVNRIRGMSLESMTSNEDQVVFPGLSAQYPTRQPENAPESNLAQRHEGFARFLKQHSSPTHQRVTAGGRIVPMVPPQPPPAFSLAINNMPHHGINVANRAPAVEGPEPEQGHHRRRENNDRPSLQHIVNAAANNSNSYNGSHQVDCDKKDKEAISEHERDSADAKKSASITAAIPSTGPTATMNLWAQYPQSLNYIPGCMSRPDFVNEAPAQQFSQSMFPSMLLPHASDIDNLTNTASKSGILNTSAATMIDLAQAGTPLLGHQDQAVPFTSAPLTTYSTDQGFGYHYFTSLANPQSAFMQPMQSPLMMSGASYQPMTMATMSPPFYPGTYQPAQIANVGSYAATFGQQFGADMTFDALREVKGVQKKPTNDGEKPKTLGAAKKRFDALTDHLQEIDRFLAVHGNSIDAEMKAARVKERLDVVYKRAAAQKSVKALENAPHPQDLPLTTEELKVPPSRSDMPASFASGAVQSPPAFNVEAPSWSPHRPVQKQAATNTVEGWAQGGVSRGQDMNYPIGSPDPNKGHVLKRQSQASSDQYVFQTPSSFGSMMSVHDIAASSTATAPKVCSTTPLRSDDHMLQMTLARSSSLEAVTQKEQVVPGASQRSARDAINVTKTDSSTKTTPRKSAKHSKSPLTDNGVSNATDADTRRLSPIQFPERQAAANHEMILDALRLPKGCVTTVNIIGEAETTVHGQGLKEPTWEDMTEQEREYWIRKPDNVFFQSLSPPKSTGLAILESLGVTGGDDTTSTNDSMGPRPQEMEKGKSETETSDQNVQKNLVHYHEGKLITDHKKSQELSTAFYDMAQRSQEQLIASGGSPCSVVNEPSLATASGLDRKGENVASEVGSPVPTSVAASKQDFQRRKSQSSVATSNVTVQAEMPPSDGPFDSLLRNTGRPAQSTPANFVPVQDRGVESIDRMRAWPYFRGFWPADIDDELNIKTKAQHYPY